MHRVIYSVRTILPADLPTFRDLETGAERPCTEQELLNMGLQRIGLDLYSCAEQYRSDADDLVEDETTGRLARAWWRADDDGPWASEAEKRSYPRSAEACAQLHGRGTLLAHGRPRERYLKLEPAHRAKALRARVITGKPVVEAALAEQQQALDEAVGLVDGRPLVDLQAPAAKLAEARRLAARPEVPEVVEQLVPMADVDPAAHVVAETDLIPHCWQGER